MNEVFRTLAHPVRRLLLRCLLERDGQTLGELEHAVGIQMTRFGVMKHLRILEQAQLVVKRKQGREARHYLDAAPIQELCDLWMRRFAARSGGTADAGLPLWRAGLLDQDER